MHWQFGEMEFGEMKRNGELEQFLHAFTSRGFDSVSWAFLLFTLWHEVFARYNLNIMGLLCHGHGSL